MTPAACRPLSVRCVPSDMGTINPRLDILMSTLLSAVLLIAKGIGSPFSLGSLAGARGCKEPPISSCLRPPPASKSWRQPPASWLGLGFSDDSRAKLTDPFCLCCLSPLMQFPLFSL